MRWRANCNVRLEAPRPLTTPALPSLKTTGIASRSGSVYYILFFFSGFPALLYQIVWQRALFTLYGVNIESVTIIVSVFMLGLGLGSLAVLFRFKISNPLLMGATAVIGLIAFPLLQPGWVFVK